MSTAGKSKNASGSNPTGSPAGSRGSPNGSDKKPSPPRVPPKPSPPQEAMQKKHLQCHCAPFALVGAICIMMVTFLCIKIYFPDVWDYVSRKLRHILGFPDETEEAHKGKPNTSTSTETTTVPTYNTSESTSPGPTFPTANEATSDDASHTSMRSGHRA
ncbi:hypothetical protein MTO96_012689 [Rhipicephalus appendiculatus]